MVQALYCALQLNWMENPTRIPQPASPCGFVAFDNGLTPSNSLDEKVAFPVTARPVSCRQVVVLEKGRTPNLSCLQSFI